MKKVYLDTNILIALVAEKEDDKRLKQRRIAVTKALNVLSEAGVSLCVSPWTLTEMVKVLINEYSMATKKVAILHNAVTRTSSIAGYEIDLIRTSPRKSYSIDNLFLDIREIMTNYCPGWGDAIHCAIMRENRITKILSTDEKPDFKIIPNLELLHPEKLLIEPDNR